MSKLQDKLQALNTKKTKLLQALNKQRANKQFRCGCGKMHRIKDCDVLKCMYYVPPSGCADGDYWAYSELQVICPVTNNKNRFLYDSYYQTDWHLRNDYEHSAELQFNRMYLDLFKSVTMDYSEDKRSWWNYYVDKNHSKFDIKLK